jgi:NitT/TauT family transport system ATP-binding protein
MHTAWATANRDVVRRLVTALYRASLWCDDAGNRDELAGLLARPDYLDMPAENLLPGLSHRLVVGGSEVLDVPDFLLFARKAATFPWISHGLWFYSQMIRWGQAENTPAAFQAARQTYRPDIYREALGPLGVSLPGASSKVEGAFEREQPVAGSTGHLILGPDGFFDGQAFDPDAFEAYVAGLPFKQDG